MPIQLFGTSGIRGDEEKLFTNQFCFDIGLSFAKFLENHRQEGPVAIGMDPRGSSPKIVEAVRQGLAYAGREILGQGAVPVSSICYFLRVSNCAGGIMVTGSHIAPGLNGIKFFAFQEEITKKQEREITNLYQEIKEKIPYQEAKISVREENRAAENYEEMLVRLADDYPQWKVVVDPGNGAQSDLIPRVLSRLGLKVITINDELQGGFLARDTETEGVLNQLQDKVIEEKADFGVAYDCDGDRVVFIDKKGRFIPGDYTGALLSKYSDTDVFVTPISTSQVVDYLNKPVVRSKVGSPYVIEAMKKTGATFGFEANGGGISSEIMMSRDAGSTTIKILNLMTERKKSLSGLLKELPKFFISRLKTNCPSGFNSDILKRAKEKFKGVKVEELDGLKIWPDETSWILFRPSNNAPEFRVFAEAKSEKKAQQLAEEGLDFVKNAIRSKSH